MKERKFFITLILLIIIIIGCIYLLSFIKEKINLSYPHIFMLSLTVLLLSFFILLLFRYLIILILSLSAHFRYKNKLPKIEDLKTVSIIIPVYNEEKILATVINSLLNLNYPKEKYEIIIVDDGSKDNSYQIAYQFLNNKKGVKLKLLSQTNQGKAKALNRGISESKGEVIVCIDSDCVLTKDSLIYGIRHFQDEKVGAVAGNVKIWNQDKIFMKLQALEYMEGLNFTRQALSFLNKVNIVPGAIGFFKREIFQKVGLYNENIYAEDCDLTLRILKAGYKVVYEPKAVVYTEAPESISCLFKQRYRWTRGILQAVRKNNHLLYHSHSSFSLILSYLLLIYEAFFWPAMNLIAHLFFTLLALLYGFIPFLFIWWFSLTLLDFSSACFAYVSDKKSENNTYKNKKIIFLYLPFLVFLYRLFYLLLIDTIKVFAFLEEALNLEMGWQRIRITGKLNGYLIKEKL
ncbi:MAG: glycosyltransferase family 2 protein [candidate division WOR-3 bacterium]|nr:glycosyltransferase family 2 protein [candidate division WOR-3 bacterium]MCX7836616.1 glycosyltransferase family 2 protein [candidate division WOR-3 bacterium]MDW8113336.1 glycosyltransferase family 2 protein [candidate division WOR-3 bacterium]